MSINGLSACTECMWMVLFELLLCVDDCGSVCLGCVETGALPPLKESISSMSSYKRLSKSGSVFCNPGNGRSSYPDRIK